MGDDFFEKPIFNSPTSSPRRLETRLPAKHCAGQKGEAFGFRCHRIRRDTRGGSRRPRVQVPSRLIRSTHLCSALLRASRNGCDDGSYEQGCQTLGSHRGTREPDRLSRISPLKLQFSPPIEAPLTCAGTSERRFSALACPPSGRCAGFPDVRFTGLPAARARNASNGPTSLPPSATRSRPPHRHVRCNGRVPEREL